MAILYFWVGDNYRKDMKTYRRGTSLYLHQDSPVLGSAQPGERLWAFTRHSDKRYVLAARLVIAEIGSTPLEAYGRYRAVPVPGSTVMYQVENGPDVEPVIRSLSLSTRARVLGSSFVGHRAVRRITELDDAVLAGFSEGLPNRQQRDLSAHVNRSAVRTASAAAKTRTESKRR